MRFSDYLLKKYLPIYQKIAAHPFNRELTAGTLGREKFDFYIEQDSHYLLDFSRALALIAGRAEEPSIVQRLLSFSLGALTAERSLHAQFLDLGHNKGEVSLSPACMGYTRYLIAIASLGSIEEAIGAVIPCFWIYCEVGKEIASTAAKNNPYSLWIETYSSEAFAHETREAIALLDEIASQSSPNTLDAIEKAFKYSAFFEWYFWDDAYFIKRFQDF